MSPASSSATLNWDAFCDLLSGISPDSVIQPETDFVGQERSSRPTGQLLFENDPTRSALERFWLKINLFGMLCQKVLVIHDFTHCPILALDPTRVQVTCHNHRSSWLPLWWGVDVNVVPGPVPPSRLLEEIPFEMARELVPVPDEVDRIYISKSIHEWPLGLEVVATALVQSVDAIPHELDGELQALVRIHLATEKLPAREFTIHDVFQVSLPIHGSSRIVRVWARKIETPERGIIVSGATEAISNDMMGLLLKLDQQALRDTRVALFRAFPLSCDVESLGLLLLRSLVAPHARAFPDVARNVRELVTRITPAVEGMDPDDAYTLYTRMRERFLEIESVLRNPGIPDELWFDGLIIVVRCLSAVSGFGFGGHASEGVGRESSNSVGVVLREVAHLAARAKVELFESEQREATIQRACEHVLAEIDRGSLR